MKMGVLVFVIIANAFPAAAIERLTSSDRSCQSIHRAVIENRSLILQFSGKSGNRNYERVVADPEQCSAGSGAAETAYFPSTDQRSCPVLVCVAVSDRRP
jgi:hypothetical protein